jgi:hypothetical protein
MRHGWALMARMTFVFMVMIVGGGLIAAIARAEAYIAVREGYKCSQCHVNKTGGGMRTDFANIYVQSRLAHTFVPWQPQGAAAAQSAVANIQHGRLNDFVTLGADMRFAYSETHIPDVDRPDRDLSIRSGLIYLQLKAVPDRASLYFDQNVQGVGTTRELFLLFDGLPLHSYVKLGRFFLASGLRLQDDTAFIRQFSGFTYGNPDSGVEIGIEPGPFSVTLWTTSIDDKRGVMGYWLSRPGRVGLSYNLDSSVEDTEKKVSNVFGGLHFGRFTALAEIDQIDTETRSTNTTVTSQALLLELDYLISRGLNLKLSYDAYDPNVDSESDIIDRLSLIFEPFVTQYLQVSIGVRDYTGQTNNDQENRNEFFVEVHGLF